MCLDRIDKQWDKPLEVDKIGWKVFQPTGNFKTLGGFINTLNTYKIGKRHYSKDNSSYRPGYRLGFHVFANKQDAEALAAVWHDRYAPHIVRKVRFSKVTAVGKDNQSNIGRTAVAREMTILP